MRELREVQPLYIVDTSPGDHQGFGKYPPERFEALWRFLQDHYVLERGFLTPHGTVSFRLFRRIG